MLKKLVITLVLLLAIPLLVALLVKRQYQVQAEVVINQPQLLVFDYIRFVSNQDNFSVWAALDPNMQKSSDGVDGTVGYISRWHSENPDVGSGEQQITAITEGERIDLQLTFHQPFSSVSHAYMTTAALSDGQTLVRWHFAGQLPYPVNLMLLVVDVEGMIAEDLQQGLENLKLILEMPISEPE